MQRIIQSCFLLCLVALCSSRHTVHVDNVFPNFGDTVLVSGPFTTDNVIAETFNVGALTVNSFKGINISTTAGFDLDGSSIDAIDVDAIRFATTDPDSVFSIVAATTLDYLATDLHFSADGELSFSALGKFEFLNQGSLSLNANDAALTGESLEVSSAQGSISFQSAASTISQSSALSFRTTNDFSVTTNNIEFNAQQAIEAISSHTSVTSNVLSLLAERNNILLQGYTSLSLEASLFDVQVKGDATIESANGNLFFQDMATVSLQAQDDIELDSHDSVRFSSTDGDILLHSTGNSFLVADAESYYNFNGLGSFTGSETFASVSAEFFLESTSGNVDLTNSGGLFTSTASDYTHVIADSRLAMTANDDITFTGSQGFDIRAERGRLFVGKLPASPSGPTPMTFNADNDLFFDGGDVSVAVTTIDITSQDIRFETADTARTAIQDWNIDNDMSFTVANSFSLGSSSVTVASDNDLDLVATNNVLFLANENAASSIVIDNQIDITDTSRGNIQHIGREFTTSSSNDLEMTANLLLSIDGREGVLIDGESDITVTTQETTHTILWASSYQAGNSIRVDNSDEIVFTGGQYRMDQRGSFIIDVEDFLVADSTNLDFDADASAIYNIDTQAQFDANRFVIVNGDQTYDEFDTVSFAGNLILASPPATDVNIDITDEFDTVGPIDIQGYDVFFDIDGDIDFSPFAFNLESFTEEDIRIDLDGDLTVTGDNITFQTADGDLDNEIIFNSFDAITINADQFSATTKHQTSIFSITTQIGVGYSNILAHDVDIRAGDDLILTADGDMSIQSNHNTHYVAEHGDIELDFVTADFNSENEIFFRSNELIRFESIGDNDWNIPREFSFTGGNVNAQVTDDLDIASADDIDFQGFSSVTVSALGTLDLLASDVLDIHGSDINMNALGTNQVLANDELKVTSGPNLPFIVTQTSTTGTNSITGDNIRFQSNDMFNMAISGTWTINAEGDILQETSAQDGGQLYYADESFAYTAANDISFTVSDSSFQGGDLSFVHSTSGDFIAGQDMFMTVTGSEYDSHFDSQVGMLFRAENSNVIFQAGNDMYMEGWRSLLLQTFHGEITHQTNVGGIAIESIQEGMALRSANKITFDTTEGDLLFTLGAYSIWQASDEIRVEGESSIDFESQGDIDLIADRGEVGFHYDGGNVMTFTADHIVSDGADAYSWSFGEDLRTQSGSLELFGDSMMEIDTSGESSDMMFTIDRDGYFISSLNNDIDFESESVITTVTEEITMFGGRDVVWDGDSSTDASSYSAGGNMRFTSEGSASVLGNDDVTFSSAASLTMTSSNLIEFEAIDSIQVGSPASIISISAGGDTSDHGVSITSDFGIDFDSENDITLTAADFTVRSEGGNMFAQKSVTIESQGADSFGEDVTFDSLDGTLTVSGDQVTTLSGASVRFEYETTFDFKSISNDVILQSATFIDIDADGSMNFAAQNKWATNANSHAYKSSGDTAYNIINSINFKTTQTVIAEADDNILFGGSTSLLFQTKAANSPIFFETQGLISEFNMEGEGSASFTAAGKTEISGKNGVLYRAAADITFTASDDFSVDTTGDFFLESVTSSITLNGVSPVGSGSRMSFSAGASLFQHVEEQITLSAATDQLAFVPDEDLIFHSQRTDDSLISDTTFTVNVSDDLIADMGGDFFFDVGKATFSAFTMDWVMNGNWPELNLGARFTSDNGDLTVTTTSGDIFLVGNDIEAEGEDVVLTSMGSSLFNSNGAMSFITTENPTSIQVTAATQAVFSATETLTVSAFGNDPTSGWIDITGTGESAATVYDWLNEPFSVGFVASNADVNIDLADGRFIYEEMSSGIVTSGADGFVSIVANGLDEFGRGIEVQGTDITLTSVTNVALRAEDIKFIELASDGYQEITPFGVDPLFGNIIYRPTIQSVHDQTYTSFGRNENGNGIEITSEVPAKHIFFDTDNVHFNSDNRMSVIAENAIVMESEFDTELITHSTMYITGEGASTDRNSISIFLADRSDNDNVDFDEGSVEFNAERDIIMESSNLLIGEISGTLFVDAQNFVATSGAVDLFAQRRIAWETDNVNVNTEGNIRITTPSLRFRSSSTATISSTSRRDGQGDIYFGSDDKDVLTGGLTFSGNTFTFASRIVDIPSHNAVVIPISTANDCSNHPDGFWFEEAGVTSLPDNNVDLVFCSVDNNVHHIPLFI